MQAAADELGIPQPSQVIGAVDDQSRQLLALANREGNEFSVLANKNGGWQELHKEYVFFTQVNTATTGNITINSTVITNIPSTAGITADIYFVDGEDLPIKAKVVSVDSGTQVTIDRPCTATTTGVTLTFAQGGYAMPSDFAYFIQTTYWDGINRWQLLGPATAQEKQVLKYGINPSGPRRRFWIRKNYMYLDPIPSTDNETIAYDYFSDGWCSSAAGVAQSTWTADTDLYLLDEDCFIQGIKWRFLRAKGLDYLEERTQYDMDCGRVMSRDGGNRDLPLGATNGGPFFLGYANIPDTNFGS